MPVSFGEEIKVERGIRTSWQDDAKAAKQIDEVIAQFVEAFGDAEVGTAKSVRGFKSVTALPKTKAKEATVLARRFNDRIERNGDAGKVHATTRKDVLHLVVGPKPKRKPRKVKNGNGEASAE